MTQTPKTALIHGLAIGFARVLNSWLNAEEMAAVVSRNRTQDPSDNSCASHDFVDSNMAMHEAFIKLLHRNPAFPSDVDDGAAAQEAVDDDTALINAAWDVAKNGDFNVDRLTTAGDEIVLEEATQSALDLASRQIQDYLGEQTGDFAGMFFSGSFGGELKDLLDRYLNAERNRKA